MVIRKLQCTRATLPCGSMQQDLSASCIPDDIVADFDQAGVFGLLAVADAVDGATGQEDGPSIPVRRLVSDDSDASEHLGDSRGLSSAPLSSRQVLHGTLCILHCHPAWWSKSSRRVRICTSQPSPPHVLTHLTVLKPSRAPAGVVRRYDLYRSESRLIRLPGQERLQGQGQAQRGIDEQPAFGCTGLGCCACLQPAFSQC